jgi:hypothetical protein
MITHEEARNLVNELVPTDAITPSQIDDLHIYITQQELKEQRAEKVEEELEEYKISDKSKEESNIEYYNMYKEYKRKYEQLKRDVKRYFEIDNQEGFYNQEEYDEWYELKKELEELK